MPRVFAHAHLAALDTFLCLFWVLALLAADRALDHRRPVAALSVAGVTLALALLTKIHAWFLLPIVVVWACVRLEIEDDFQTGDGGSQSDSFESDSHPEIIFGPNSWWRSGRSCGNFIGSSRLPSVLRFELCNQQFHFSKDPVPRSRNDSSLLLFLSVSILRNFQRLFSGSFGLSLPTSQQNRGDNTDR